jgi:hypothetical protein
LPPRALRTSLRAVHVVAVAALYGGHVFAVEAERLVPAVVAAVATGAALMAFEIYRAPVWCVQVRGAATFAKIALVAGVGVFWSWRVPLLTIAMVVGVVTSHMPGRWRYRSLLDGRVVGSPEKG